MTCLPPQKPNEVRVQKYDWGNGPVVQISTPNVLEILQYDTDGKTLLTRTLECTLKDTTEERVIQSLSINLGKIASTYKEHSNKKTHEVTGEFYSVAGELLYTQKEAPEKPIRYTDARGNPIDEKAVHKIWHTCSEQAVEIDKVKLSN
jgi:hypothetical protein